MKNCKIVVVLGMHRSGTSALTRGLRVLQVDMGDNLIPGQKGLNDKGYWEDADINDFNERLLERLGSSWFGLSHLEEERLLDTELDDMREEARSLLKKKVNQHAYFGFKDPRTSVLLPFWQSIFKQLKLDDVYLIAVRNPLDVVASLKKRDSLPAIESYLLWAKYTFSALHYSKSRARVLVHYDELLDAPEEQLNKIAAALDIQTEFHSTNELQKYIGEFLSKDLRHNKSSLAALNREPRVPLFVRQAYERLQKVTKGQIDLDSRSFIKDWVVIEQDYLKTEGLYSHIDNLNAHNAESQTALEQNEVERKKLQKEMSKVAGVLEYASRERDQAFIEQGNMEAQKDQAEQERSNVSQELHHVQNDYKRIVEERDAALTARETLITEREQAIKQHEKVVADKERVKQERDSARAEQKLLSERLDDVHREIGVATATRDAAIIEREQAIKQHEKVVADKERVKQERDSARAEQKLLSERLDDVHREIGVATAARDAAITEREQTIKQYEEAVQKYQKLQSDLKLIQKRVDREVNLRQQKEIELKRILSSNSWRITSVLRAIRRNVITRPYSFIWSMLSNTMRVIWQALPGSPSRKHRLKGYVFRSFPTFLGWTRAYQVWGEFERQQVKVNQTFTNKSKPVNIESVEQHKSISSPHDFQPVQTSARLIALYLPQFHPIPENDMWWGKGFTEWTNTAKAQPLFPGHEIPNVPTELGYYDLRVEESREAQAELAREYGIEGFCYWHYWFGNGKRLLERPFDEVLESGKPDFPFCLAWANHTWSGVWHGCPDEILIEQTYPGAEDIKAHFYSLLDAFKDERYLKIDGRNIFSIYRPTDLENASLFLETWRELAEKEGAPDFYFIAITDYPWDRPQDGYDAFTTNPPVGMLPYQGIKPMNEVIEKEFSLSGDDLELPEIYSYETFIENAFPKVTLNKDFYPSVVPKWDNTPRSGSNGFALHGSTPELYGKHLNEAVGLVEDREPDQRVIFIKSWNEWAETNYLEPDLKWGKAYLEKTLEIIGSKED